MTTKQRDYWREEAGELYAGGPAPYDPEFLAQCAICHTPVRAVDLPAEVIWTDGRPGLIHGAFDCTDEPRCEETTHGDAPGTGEWSQRCILPASHYDVTPCLWGVPG